MTIQSLVTHGVALARPSFILARLPCFKTLFVSRTCVDYYLTFLKIGVNGGGFKQKSHAKFWVPVRQQGSEVKQIRFRGVITAYPIPARGPKVIGHWVL
jgi:hypothetical protein